MADLRQQLQSTLGSAYTLERELGGGGMSRVFVSTENRLRRQVVVKVLSTELAAGVSAERFEREIQLAASLQQANIVPLLSAGDTNGIPYYTMPFVEGESLRSKLAKSGRLPIAEAVSVLRDLARALSYAHARGVAHRDIKPDNILLSHGAAVVTDFGIAKAISASRTQSGATLTQAGTSIGTPAYMSPEQVAGDDTADHRVDLYAFGCVAYELLTGHTPFTESSPQRMLAAHLSQTPKSVRDDRPDAPGALAALVMRCLAKSADDRPASADEVLQALESIATPSGGYPTGVATSQAQRRQRFGALGLGLGAAVLGVIAIFAILKLQKPKAAVDTSIAVLPLVNLSGDTTNNYFGEGLAEEITGGLAKAGLRVIGRGGARGLAARGLDVRDIAKQLSVANVLQGNVQRAGDQVRITVSLMSGADGSVKWTEKYDRQLKDVFGVQDEIAKAVVSQLSATLAAGSSTALVRTETVDPEAHSLYLQGLYLFNRRNEPALRQAIAIFERAVARDPKYARAYAGIALAYTVLPHYSDELADSLTVRGRDAAEKALAIDSTLAEAWTALAYGHTQHWENAQAEAAFQRAIRSDSTFATTRHWYGLLLFHTGRPREADRELAVGRQLEPTSMVVALSGVQLLINEGRNSEAFDAVERIVAFDSTYTLGRATRATVLTHMGRYDEALHDFRAVENLPGVRPSELKGELAYTLARAGKSAEARSVLAEIQRAFKGRPVPSNAVAAALYEVGEQDAAIAALKAAVEQHDPWLTNFGRSPRCAKLRADPRGRALLESTEKPIG